MKITLSVGKYISNWFTRRAIETVDSWDGAASNYDSTEAYCKSCLIDVTPSGKDKSQTYCKLPVKRPGSNKYADKGIIAASGGRGLSAAKKPADVDQAKWDSAVTKAAKTIVSAYKDMNKEPPSSMMEMAGMARAISVDSIFQQLQSAMYDGMDTWNPTGATMEYPGYLVTVYIDSGELYALFNKEGLLRRALLTLGDNDVVTLGELEDVSQQFMPTQRSSVTVTRQADGNYRVFMLAATALINKQGQIDSTLLFDDMIRRAEEYDYWPTIDFAHLGEDDESCEFGQVDWLGRDGVCYLASGVLYQDHPITPYMVDALQKRSAEWGNSIEYYPVPDSVDYIEVGKLEIPVFTQGLNTRIAILPVDDACSWFTMVEMEQRTMNEKQKAALKKLLGEEEFNRRMSLVEDVNGKADKQKLIFRATTPEAESAVAEPVAETPTEVSAEEPVAEEEAELGAQIELDDEAVLQIATAVTDSTFFTTTVTALVDKLTGLMADLTKMQTSLTTLQTGVTRMDTRLQAVEKEEGIQESVRQADTPRKVKDAKMRMTYRPREQRADPEDSGEEDYGVIAAKTLEKIPNIGGYN